MSRPPGEIELDTLTAAPFTGSAAAVYPNLAYLGEITWAWPVWIVALQFSTSLTIYPSDLGGMLITFDQTAKTNIAVGRGLKSVIAHITAPNSLAGPPAIGVPSSKVSNITFNNCGYFLDANSPISLYAFANATAGNYLFAITSIQYRRVNRSG